MTFLPRAQITLRLTASPADWLKVAADLEDDDAPLAADIRSLADGGVVEFSRDEAARVRMYARAVGVTLHEEER